MKIPLCSVGLFLFTLISPLHAGGSLACGGSLEVTMNGKASKAETLGLMTNVQALLESCSVDSSAYAASEKKWKSLLTTPSYLHYTLPNGAQFSLQTKGGLSIEVEEIILPFPSGAYPDHIYVKNRQGYFSYAKYDPRILRKIVAATEVSLISKPPYSTLPDEAHGAKP